MSPRNRLFLEIALQQSLLDRTTAARLLQQATSEGLSLRQVLLNERLLTSAQADEIDAACDRLLSGRGGRDASVPAANLGNVGSPAGEKPRASIPEEPRHVTVSAAVDEARAPYLHKVLTYAMRKGASDLHVHADAPLAARIDAQLAPLKGDAIISNRDAYRMIAQLLTQEQLDQLNQKGQLDFAYTIADVGRFRVNVYRSFRGTDAVFRLIPSHIRTLAELQLPESLTSLTDFRTGIVLCTGPTGCGKSTTLAALLQHLNCTRQEHIITLENPVEHVYPSGMCWVNQREVRSHTQSFSRALRAALREDPDVIAITELRDRESMGLALSAAETGHLVLGTLHTASAAQTISRIINAFPGPEQEHVRAQLSEGLRAVISQRLLPRADGQGLVPAVEVLIVTTAVANIIRDDKVFQLPSVMQTGKALGMTSLDDSLQALVAQGVVLKKDAHAIATQKERFL